MSSQTPSTILDGWNDPPANLPSAETISTKRVLLNKRVPYTNQDLQATNTANVLTSPPPCSSSSSLATSLPSMDDPNASGPEPLLTIDEINEIFQSQVKKLDESLVEKKVLEDIGKKFQVMQDEWRQEKLSSNTKQALSNLFYQLQSGHTQQAFDLHVTLVRNAGSEVVRFIVGIKRLIQELQRLSN